MAALGMKVGRGRGVWVVTWGPVVRIFEAGSSIEVNPCLAAPRRDGRRNLGLRYKIGVTDFSPGSVLRGGLRPGGHQ